jgi:glycine/D-amino acid oxidase-like deaminating enzyme
MTTSAHPAEGSYWTRGLVPVENSAADSGGLWDAVVIGAGFAGLSCSLELAQAGMRVLVLDASKIGQGASSKAAGSLANLPKAKLGDLTKLYDAATAAAVYREYATARQFTEGLVGRLGIDCDLQTSLFRVLAAHTEKAFRRVRADAQTIREKLPKARLLEREELTEFIGSTVFHGGLLVPDCATINPAKLQFGLARCAIAAGASIVQDSRVSRIEEQSGVFQVSTPSGFSAHGKHLVIATNAQTADWPEPLLSRLATHIAAVPSFVVVTEPLPEERVHRIIKGARIFGDTSKVLNYLALAPCGTRIVLSSRAGFQEGSTWQKAQRIHADMSDRFPALEGSRIEHYWSGRFAITEDLIPHIGRRDRLHWVLGCCGAGITMVNYLGCKLARGLLGADDAATVFSMPMPKVPAWKRRPAVFGAAVRTYRVYDRFMN